MKTIKVSTGVDTFYADRGRGLPLVMLHPGLVDSRALDGAAEALSEDFHVYTPDRRGHGRTPDVDGPLTYDLMADDTIAFIEAIDEGPVKLMGYSDGAVVALLVTKKRPDLVERLVFAAGVFNRDGWETDVLDADAEPPHFMKESYGEVSPDGIDHYDVVSAKVAEDHKTEPSLRAGDLTTIFTRTLIMIGDDDEVRLEHSIEALRSLPDAELAVIPGASHAFLVEKQSLALHIISEFLIKIAAETFAPIRRA